MVDLGKQMQMLGGKDVMLRALGEVMESEQFIGGSLVSTLENTLAAYCGRKFGVACASGTDALLLSLMALDNIRHETVVVPAFGFPAAVEAAVLLGARVALVDIRPDGMMDPDALEKLLKGAPRKPAAVIVMDMFGAPADYLSIASICEKFGVFLICDAAQSFGAELDGKKAARFGLATTTSFFPAKPLGCYGDGGMVFTDDPKMEVALRLLRNHGMMTKYQFSAVGTNSRLDALQAAVLLKKFPLFERELETRRIMADLLEVMVAESSGIGAVPLSQEGNLESSWACFSLVAKSIGKRAELLKKLQDVGIPYAIHYPTAFCGVTAYRPFIQYNDGGCKVACWLADRIFQVPFHPYLTSADLDRIVQALLH